MLLRTALRSAVFALPLIAAVPAAAVTFFSLGGAPDPGLAKFETMLVNFDTPTAAGIVQTNVGAVGLYTGSSSSAAAPAGDTSRYLGIGKNGSATFDFRTYFDDQMSLVRSISLYVGSVDTYNFIDVLDKNLNTVKTIGGSDLPGSNGDQGAAITNRRLYINFLPQETIGGLRFRSTGVAFELDSIGASRAVFNTNGNQSLSVLPNAAVPEASTWSMLIAGFGLIGLAARRRKSNLVAA
jgi:hypothetical protein